MIRRLVLAALALLALPILALIVFVLAVAIGTPPVPPAPSLLGRVEAREIEHEGRARRWLLYVPERPGSPAPLVMVLPGSGQRIESMRQVTGYRFEELASRDGALVVYAEGWEKGGLWSLSPEWNECRKSTDLPARRVLALDLFEDAQQKSNVVDVLTRSISAGFTQRGSRTEAT